MTGRRLPLLVFCASIVIAVVVPLTLLAGRSEAVGPASPNQMRLDATAGGSIDASRSVTGLGAFTVGISVTQLSATPYKSYQWEIEFPTAGLTYVGGSEVENTGATGLTTCTPPSSSQGVLNPVDDTTEGNGSGCALVAAGSGTSFVGQVTTFDLQCVNDGTFAVLLLNTDDDPLFGSGLNDSTGGPLATGTTGISVTCSGTGSVAPTATPTNTATQTFTPGPPTATRTQCTGASCPTATATLPPDFTRTPTPKASTTPTVAAGTPVPTEPAPPGGGSPGPAASSTRPTGTGTPGGSISGPNTGNGGYADGADDRTIEIYLAVVGSLSLLAGAGLVTLGQRTREL